VNFRPEPAHAAVGDVNFDLLRAKVESQVERPAVIAITAPTAHDGKETAVQGLTDSLVTAGYATLLLDTRLAGRSVAKPAQRLTFEEVGRRLIPDCGVAKLMVLNLGDVYMQKSASQRDIQAGLEILRTRFDYVVINLDFGASKAFAASVVGASDAVLVTVKVGRRETSEDARLSADLESIGSRFLGVVALDPSIIGHNGAITPVQDDIPDWRRSEVTRGYKEHQRRGVI
jgi:Mrp family chromosome partitioning ATPase